MTNLVILLRVVSMLLIMAINTTLIEKAAANALWQACLYSPVFIVVMFCAFSYMLVGSEKVNGST